MGWGNALSLSILPSATQPPVRLPFLCNSLPSRLGLGGGSKELALFFSHFGLKPIQPALRSPGYGQILQSSGPLQMLERPI